MILSGVALLLSAIACSGVATGITNGFTKITDAITQPSAREIYQREFKNDTTSYNAWAAAYNTALHDSTLVKLPYGEKGTFVPNSNVAYTYTINVKEGEVLVAGVTKDSLSRVFIDIYGEGKSRPLISNEHNEEVLTYTPQSSGVYKVVLQPEISAESAFFISIATRPLYGFPVSGKGNSAIMSFWGMERDGGKRTHEGIDIFAKKGTPVIAVADGYITHTGNHGLGGKQVWLRDGLLGRSLYYAHLDSIAVTAGTRVKTGSVLGFVGNTGNAKFTPPHLHFGIYTGYGAIDPLPFVFSTPNVTPPQYQSSFKPGTLRAKTKGNLRQGPDTKYPAVGGISAGQALTLLGQHNSWLHIKTASGQQAFVHKTLVAASR